MYFPTIPQLKQRLKGVIEDKRRQGHDIEGCSATLEALPDSYDAHWQFAQDLANLPFRADWQHHEPETLDDIKAACGDAWNFAPVAVTPEDSARRIESAFKGSVCGCVLGKPIEIMPTLATLQAAFEPLGEWPMRDYVSEQALERLGKRNYTWRSTVRENICFVEPDDDMNYTIMGMLVLEKYGGDFTQNNLRRVWLEHNCAAMTWGPERTQMLNTYVAHTFNEGDTAPVDEWAKVLNPGDELCGAQIRADAYGYACAGDPARAAELAFRDASFTHRKTGVYATMWTAAAIAAAFIAPEPLEIFRIANRFVPPNSRFAHIVTDSLAQVEASSDWLDGYNRIHDRYGEYGHCCVYQESGTLINTLRWAQSVDDGFCKQVMQGNDTDSYGATAGSILGAFFGPGHMEDRWLTPFNDDIRTGLSGFYERSLDTLARRMGELPTRI